MFDAVIEAGRDRSIAQSSTRRRASAPVPRSACGDDLRPNRDEPERLYAGITLVGKRARIPRGVRDRPQLPDRPRASIERDFGRRRRVRSGETIVAGTARL